jgi:hypothetical protein
MSKMDRRAYRIAQIRKALLKGPFDKVDRLVAQNLHAMLEEAEKGGHPKKTIIAKALKREDLPYYALKQLDRLTAPPDCSDARAQRLDKKPTNYRRVAEVWAQEMGKDEGEALFRLFGDSDFGRNISVATADELQPWSLLAKGLRDCAQHVIRLEDMRTYWRQIIQTSGNYEPRSDNMNPARGRLFNSTVALASCSSCSDEVEPVPSIRLTRRLQCVPIYGMVWLAPNGVDADSAIADPGPPTKPPAGLIETPALYRLWLDIRLGMGPASSLDDIAPLIELRSNLEVEIDGQVGYPDNQFTDGSDTVNHISLAGRLHRVSLNPPEDLPLAFHSASFWMAEHSYFAWAQVTAETLREVLDDSADLPNGDQAFEWEGGQRHLMSILPSWLDGLERRLRSGELEEDLIARAQTLKTMLAAHRQNLREAFDADLNAATQRQGHREPEAATPAEADSHDQ